MKMKRLVRRRKWPWLLGGMVVLIFLLILAAPLVLSSQGFTKMIQARISRSTGGTATIGDLSLGWLKGLRISEFSFRDRTGWTSVSVRKIAAQPRLTALLGGNLTLGETVIDKPQVEIDLRQRPPARQAGPAGKSSQAQSATATMALTTDLVVNDGNVRLTDTAGKTVEIRQINSTARLRPPGQRSSVQVDMVVADAGQPGKIRASGQIDTPKEKTGSGWSLKGTTGEFTVEVNDLNVESLGSLLALAGVDMRGKGTLSANVASTIVDGRLQDVTARVRAANVDVTGAEIKGDRVQTSRLNVDAKLTQKGKTFQVDKLEAQTDWASVTATGAVPTSVTTLTDLLQSDAAYGLKGQFDCNVAALLSQMPKTFGIKEGMQITSGRASGSVETTTQAGRATVVAQTSLVGLTGTMDGKELSLSEPVTANLKLAANEKKTQLESLNVSAAFARIAASGDFANINYNGTVDLAKLQAELGQFANLGPYEMAGELASTGKVSIEPNDLGATGSASIKQLVLASTDGNSVSEPAANIDFAVNLDKEKQVLAIDNVAVKSTVGNVTVKKGTVPLDKASPAAMKLDVTARDLDLKKAKPYAVFFGALPKKAELSGSAASELALTGQAGRYRIRTDNTAIRNFRLQMPGEKAFDQNDISVVLDVELDPNDKSVTVEKLQIKGEQIEIKRGELKRSQQDGKMRIEGALEGEGAGEFIGSAASVFLPEKLELTGRSTVNLNFASTYPAEDPNQLLPNLTSRGRVGCDSAKYMGLRFGAIDVNVAVVEGLMRLAPFQTTVNEGQLRFAAQANFKQKPTLLQTPGPLLLAQNVRLNTETTEKLLKFINPIFANMANVSGEANFDCEKLVIPLTPGHEKEIQIVGTFSCNNLDLRASPALNNIFTASGKSLRDQRATIRPTRLVVRDGTVSYENMQIDVGDNPLNFGGVIGFDGRLNMTVTLPWTWRGRTTRVDREGEAGARITIPLRGTVNKVEIDTSQFLQQQLFKGLEDLLRR
ncbi:MAG: hypothetical protein JW741_29505 [Sedimentisphaerales bacterium]|nr:hypothetical protein [Sedimentisphaerales bacterium]